MRGLDRRTVRPVWVCETQGGLIEQGRESDVSAGPSGSAFAEEEIGMPEGETEEHGENDPEQECGRRRTKPMLDPKLTSEGEVRQHT